MTRGTDEYCQSISEEADKAGYIMAGSTACQVRGDTDEDGTSSQGSRPRLQISESYVDSQHSRPT